MGYAQPMYKNGITIVIPYETAVNLGEELISTIMDDIESFYKNENIDISIDEDICFFLGEEGVLCDYIKSSIVDIDLEHIDGELYIAILKNTDIEAFTNHIDKLVKYLYNLKRNPCILYGVWDSNREVVESIKGKEEELSKLYKWES